MAAKEKEVLVLDANRCFLSYTHPAIARKLLRDGRAIIYSRDPFTIQMSNIIDAIHKEK